MSPPPRTPSAPRLRGPFAISSARRRQFRARPLRHQPGPHESEQHLQQPRLPRPLATGPPTPHRTGLGPPAPNHHTPPGTSGTPAWGRTTAKQPRPLSCPGGHTVKSGACDSRTARVGYCECFSACRMFSQCSECF